MAAFTPFLAAPLAARCVALGDDDASAQRADNSLLCLFKMLAEQARGEPTVACAQGVDDCGMLSDKPLGIAPPEPGQADADQSVGLFDQLSGSVGHAPVT